MLHGVIRAILNGINPFAVNIMLTQRKCTKRPSLVLRQSLEFLSHGVMPLGNVKSLVHVVSDRNNVKGREEGLIGRIKAILGNVPTGKETEESMEQRGEGQKSGTDMG